MPDQLVRLDREGPVAWLTLTREKTANAIDLAVLDALAARLDQAESDASIRCAIVTGAGRTFSAGGDIGEMLRLTPAEGRRFVARGQAVLERVAASRLVVIAALNGHTLGGGAELALACDLRVAAAEARIGFPEVGLGLIPGWGGTQRAARLIGSSRASLLVLTGRRLSAEDALLLGLVDVVVPRSELETECTRLASEIASRSPSAVAAAKRAIVQGARASFTDGLRIEAEAWLEAFSTNDRVEGLTAFLEKREPRWTSS